MRVLVVSPQVPLDFSRSVYGGFQRLRMWLDAIRSLQPDLDILFYPRAGVAAASDAAAVAQGLREAWDVPAEVTLCEREPDDERGGLLARYANAYLRPALGPSQHTLFRPFLGKRQKAALARCLARSPDIVLFHRPQSAGPALSSPLNGARVFLDLDDVQHRVFAREVRQPPRWRLKPLLYLQVPALWWGERGAIVRAERAFVCSENDRRYLRRTMRVRNVDVVPNAVPRIADRALTADPTVLFLGAYSYAPNVVAAEYLVREVWPRLIQLHPAARLLIAGPGAEEIPGFHHPPPGVEFLGFVPDLDSLYRRVRVVCCPIQSGGGTRIKILEAASHGIPVVATPIGAEGLDLVPEREILLRRDPRGLAQACADLLADGARASRIGTAARQRVRALYARDAVVRRMATLLFEGVR
jgi:glycosyltransferase involved in cell wall biosynthesis